MNRFVIMPFQVEFDDVYATIKATIDKVVSDRGGRCFRLDESRPAGRITDRLLGMIQSAAFCVADVTDCNPNVMWEVGYAMALQKPTILLTQKMTDLPFDIRDIHTIEYDRGRLSRTLGDVLQRTIIDTMNVLDSRSEESNPAATQGDELVGTLLAEIRGLKDMVASVVRDWHPPANPTMETGGADFADLTAFEGAWRSFMHGSCFYAKVVRGELVVPYSYYGNSDLNGVYYEWKRSGDYWFARYRWLNGSNTGFAFLRQESADRLTGAWWADYEVASTPSKPPTIEGTQIIWKRDKHAKFPDWASDFLEEVGREGLESLLDRGSSPKGAN